MKAEMSKTLVALLKEYGVLFGNDYRAIAVLRYLSNQKPSLYHPSMSEAGHLSNAAGAAQSRLSQVVAGLRLYDEVVRTKDYGEYPSLKTGKVSVKMLREAVIGKVSRKDEASKWEQHENPNYNGLIAWLTEAIKSKKYFLEMINALDKASFLLSDEEEVPERFQYKDFEYPEFESSFTKQIDELKARIPVKEYVPTFAEALTFLLSPNDLAQYWNNVAYAALLGKKYIHAGQPLHILNKESVLIEADAIEEQGKVRLRTRKYSASETESLQTFYQELQQLHRRLQKEVNRVDANVQEWLSGEETRVEQQFAELYEEYKQELKRLQKLDRTEKMAYDKAFDNAWSLHKEEEQAEYDEWQNNGKVQNALLKQRRIAYRHSAVKLNIFIPETLHGIVDALKEEVVAELTRELAAHEKLMAAQAE